jgi:hypothetical protein
MAPHDPNMVAALRRERAGYVARGLDERVAQVDEQLAHYGAAQADEPQTPQGRTGQDPAQQTVAPAGTAHDSAAGATDEADKPRRGRPRKPRDDAGNIVRE